MSCTIQLAEGPAKDLIELLLTFIAFAGLGFTVTILAWLLWTIIRLHREPRHRGLPSRDPSIKSPPPPKR